MAATGVIISIISIIVIILGFKYFFFPTMSIKDFLMLKFLNKEIPKIEKEEKKENRFDEYKGDTPPNEKKCYFQGQDIINGYVFLKPINKKITDNSAAISCKNCNNYYSKIDGECSNYIYEEPLNETSLLGVCTSNPRPSGTRCP